MPIELSVILPTYNERENIAALIRDIASALAGVDHEVLVVDDRSPDGTAELARKLAEEMRQVRVAEREPPPGLTISILDGVRMARGRYVSWMDADFSHPPALLPQLLAPLREGRADITCASRYVAGGADERMSPAARWASVIITRLAHWIVDRRVLDYTTGYVMAPRELVLNLGLHGDYGEYCIDLLARAVRGGHRVLEIPYRSTERRSGESKTAPNVLGFARRGWRYLLVIMRLAIGPDPRG
jgi:dolichol-phosphate mannosyltransferase